MTVKLFVLALLVLRIDGQLEQCFVDTHSPYVYFSSKTSYYASRKSEINVPEKCSPTYLWTLIRHGTRYPDSEFIDSMKSLYSLRDEIVKNHKEGRGKLCIKDLENLEKWSSNVTADVAGDLTAQGVKDVISLAQRLKEKFPNLLKSTFHNSFLFESSSCLRAKKSAIAFSNELLDTNYQDTKGNSIIENEGLLHIIKYCEAYTNEVENNNLTFKEATLFQDTELVKKVISEISERLGFKQQLSFDLVKVMHGICAYESAWYINSRPAFCAAFLPDHLKVFEYYNDMKYYYVNGYGTPLTEKIGCIMVKDMMTSLSKAAENIEETPKATFYFSHSEMILPTTVKLGLNRDDEAPKHDNYDLMKDDRKWRLASFDSFAANIIAVLYKCSSPDGDQNKVIFYQNERQIELPKCAQNSCNLENLLQNFPEVFNETQCNLDFCESESVKKSEGNLVSFKVNVFLVIFVICRYVL